MQDDPRPQIQTARSRLQEDRRPHDSLARSFDHASLGRARARSRLQAGPCSPLPSRGSVAGPPSAPRRRDGDPFGPRAFLGPGANPVARRGNPDAHRSPHAHDPRGHQTPVTRCTGERNAHYRFRGIGYDPRILRGALYEVTRHWLPEFGVARQQSA